MEIGDRRPDCANLKLLNSFQPDALDMSAVACLDLSVVACFPFFSFVIFLIALEVFIAYVASFAVVLVLWLLDGGICSFFF